MCVCSSLTMLREQVTVDDVYHTVQLLFDQSAQRNLEDELCEELAAGREENMEREEQLS